MERRDRARQAAAARKAAAAAAAAAAQEGNAAEGTDAPNSDSAKSGGGAGLDFLKRNNKFGALFPLSGQKESKQDSVGEEVSERAVVDQKGGKEATTGSSRSPPDATANAAAATVSGKDDIAAGSGETASSSSVEELVESMVANPSGASKAMKQQFAVFVREDGTVDFDKAVETGKEVGVECAWVRACAKLPYLSPLPLYCALTVHSFITLA
jgi:hypothetical protein